MTMEKTKYDYEIGEIDQYLFGKGEHLELYRKLGAHTVYEGDEPTGVYFAVWAPHAASVSVVASAMAKGT
jgi:1,4-alpha-glucan branching enzyme